MIVVQMSGGVGEQLFKYAAARNFSLIYRENLLIDISWFIKNKKAKNSPNKVSLAEYNTSFGLAGSVIINNFMKTKQTYYLNRFPDTAKYKVVTEAKTGYSNALYITNPPFYMIGEYKNEKYFEENIEQIIEDFTLKISNTKKLVTLSKKVETQNSVGILITSSHINKNNIVVENKTNWDYVKSAIKYYKENVNKAHFFFVTDIENIESQLEELEISFEIISLFQNENEWKNIQLLSKCKYFIADNSATSWWAAWLNFTPNRTVIIPQDFAFEYPQITHNKLGIQQNWIKL